MLFALAVVFYLVSDHLRDTSVLQRGPELPSES